MFKIPVNDRSSADRKARRRQQVKILLEINKKYTQGVPYFEMVESFLKKFSEETDIVVVLPEREVESCAVPLIDLLVCEFFLFTLQR